MEVVTRGPHSLGFASDAKDVVQAAVAITPFPGPEGHSPSPHPVSQLCGFANHGRHFLSRSKHWALWPAVLRLFPFHLLGCPGPVLSVVIET